MAMTESGEAASSSIPSISDEWWWLGADDPEFLLFRLAEDPDPTVRLEVALNPVTPATVLSMLASDPIRQVRLAVAGSASVSSEVLIGLAGDPDEGVCAKAGSQLIKRRGAPS